MAAIPELVVVNGELAGRRFAVPEGGLRLGRSSSNDVKIIDGELSRNHCLFERDGKGSVRVIDLASANGTFVNGKQLGSEPAALRPGDRITAGSTEIAVVAEGAAAPAAAVAADGKVDLGLDAPAGAAPSSAAAGGKPRSRRTAANLLWAVAGGCILAATALVLLAPQGRRSAGPAAKNPAGGKQSPAPGIALLVYERVDADATHIARYRAEIDGSGAAKVVFSDVPGQNRMVNVDGTLTPGDMEEVARIFSSGEWDAMRPSYSGTDAATMNALKSRRLRLVRDGAVKEVLIDNAAEPDAFRSLRERLETLVNNSLGLQSIGRSRAELLASSAHSEEIGDSLWESRSVEYKNLFDAIRSYKSAKNDLATLGAGGDDIARLQSKIERTERALDDRLRDASYEAERAKSIGDWETARAEFRKICDMVPDRADSRHVQANANLIDIENRIDAAGKKGRGR